MATASRNLVQCFLTNEEAERLNKVLERVKNNPHELGMGLGNKYNNITQASFTRVAVMTLVETIEEM